MHNYPVCKELIFINRFVSWCDLSYFKNLQLKLCEEKVCHAYCPWITKMEKTPWGVLTLNDIIVHPTLYPSICLSICVPNHLTIHLSICPSICSPMPWLEPLGNHSTDCNSQAWSFDVRSSINYYGDTALNCLK